VRDAEGGGERSEPPALPCGHYEKDKYNERNIQRLKTMITMNDEATRIAEAIAKPGAARPEHTTAN